VWWQKKEPGWWDRPVKRRAPKPIVAGERIGNGKAPASVNGVTFKPIRCPQCKKDGDPIVVRTMAEKRYCACRACGLRFTATEEE
jgi:hypothetical protein